MDDKGYEKRIKELTEKSGLDLLAIIGRAPNTPEAELAHAILQQKLSENIVRLDKTSERYSKILLVLTIVLLFVGMMQLFVSIFQIGGFKSILLALGCSVLLWFIFWKMEKVIFKDDR